MRSLSSVPINGSAYAWAYLDVSGPGVFGGGLDGKVAQHSVTESVSTATGLGNVHDERTLQANFVNLTNSAMTGTIIANASVYKYGFIPTIPEPGTYAMMLAGLGLCAFVAWRRKPDGAPA